MIPIIAAQPSATPKPMMTAVRNVSMFIPMSIDSSCRRPSYKMPVGYLISLISTVSSAGASFPPKASLRM